jgi:hypothetical protein
MKINIKIISTLYTLLLLCDFAASQNPWERVSGMPVEYYMKSIKKYPALKK